MKKDIFRKEALERLNAAQKLDKALEITSPMSTLALAAATILVAVFAVWSFVGVLPESVTASGVIAAPVGTNTVYTDETGTVNAVYVQVGMQVYEGTPLVGLTLPRGESVMVYSDQVGVVSEIVAPVGTGVTQGSDIVRVSPLTHARQVVVCYIPSNSEQKIERGMMAHVTLTSAQSETYGHMAGRVVNIDARAASQKSMDGVLGTDNDLSSAFKKDGSVICVTCELYKDEESVSGFYWSNEKGRSQTVSNGSLCTVRIITREIAPIEKLFTKLREIWGD